MLAFRHGLARDGRRCGSRSRNWQTTSEDVERSTAAILDAALAADPAKTA